MTTKYNAEDVRIAFKGIEISPSGYISGDAVEIYTPKPKKEAIQNSIKYPWKRKKRR